METVIIGAGSDLGVHIDGSRLGPEQLLNDIKSFYNKETTLIKQDEDIIKSRNLSDRRKNEYEIDRFNSNIYNTILKCKKEKFFPIVIGGDSTVSIPIALASSKTYGDIGIIWFSAFTGYNTFETTTTGNINDLALAAITGWKNQELRYYTDANVIQPIKTVIIGVRDINDWEKDNIKYSGTTVFTVQDIQDKGLDAVIEEAFKIATNNTKGVHINFDLGIIDPESAPGVSIPKFNGITEEEAMNIINIIRKKIKDIVSFSLVEYNPLRDENRKTEQTAINILARIINSAENKNEFKN